MKKCVVIWDIVQIEGDTGELVDEAVGHVVLFSETFADAVDFAHSLGFRRSKYSWTQAYDLEEVDLPARRELTKRRQELVEEMQKIDRALAKP